MSTIERELVIQRPVEEVFDYLADARNEPRYNSNIILVELLPDGPIGPGSRFRLEARAFGRPVTTIYEVTAYDPPRRVVSRTISAQLGLDIEGTVTVTPAPGGSRVRWTEEVTVHGIFSPLEPLTTRLLRHRLDAARDHLKQLLEARNAEGNGGRW